jgi:hypothetical protein
MLTVVALGAIATALAAWCIWRKKAPRFSVWAAFVGGLTLGYGLLARASEHIAAVAERAGSRGTVLLFGAAIPAVLAVITIAELVHAGHPKKGKPHRWIHPVLGFVAPALLLAAGGVFAQIIGWAHGGVDQVPTTLTSVTH